MVDARKPEVSIAGVPLAATQAIAWRFQTGTAPYRTVMSVYKDQWAQLKQRIGAPVDLKIVDSRGATTTVRELYILHVVPSSKPSTVSFMVADKRWLWAYKLVVRDYNVTKKTGDRTALNQVPIEQQLVVDRYRYRSSSLKEDGKKWTAKDVVKDVLTQLEGDEGADGPAEDAGFVVESFPIRDADEEGDDGQFSLQNVTLRDQGDVALSRALSFVPGAEVYVDTNGVVRVIDAADLNKAEQFVQSLPPATWDGDALAMVDRSKIRPKEVFVYFEREVELLLDFEDDYAGVTSADPPRNSPFIENVLPTVDPVTRVYQFDPELNQTLEKNRLPPGTWVSVKEWLAIMDELKGRASWPWTFDTLRQLWVVGDLDGALGSGDVDDDPDGIIALRVQALKSHFRQTFRISRRYMERIRDLKPVRVAMLDPVTGARAPAAVWGQTCMIPTEKGGRMLARSEPALKSLYRNLDMLKPSIEEGKPIIETAPGPAQVSILDRELGIIRVDWLHDPYGYYHGFTPGLLVGESGNTPRVPSGDLSEQDTEPMGVGMRIAEGSNGLFLAKRMRMKVLLTVIPGAPNNLRQLHRVQVDIDDIKDLFEGEFRIQAGDGPALHIFVPPSQATARFAWKDDAMAKETMEQLLGLDTEDLAEQGLEDEELPGFVLSNKEAELDGYAMAVAAEQLVAYADSIQGNVAGIVPSSGLKLVGNMAGATVQVAAFPSGKVSALHEFPGTQKPINRLAMLPDTARHYVLGILQVGIGD